MTTATPARLLVRPITAEDNPAIAHVIREVSAEHGLTADKGYTVSDPNLTPCISSTARRAALTG